MPKINGNPRNPKTPKSTSGHVVGVVETETIQAVTTLGLLKQRRYINIRLHYTTTIRQLLYCILCRYLYSTSHDASQTAALSVRFSTRKKVRQERERQVKGDREGCL